MQTTTQTPKLALIAPPATPPLDEVVALLRATDLSTANRQIAQDYPQSTFDDRKILLREATRLIWQAWVESKARKEREKLARRNWAAHTIEHDPPEDADEAEDC